MFQRTRNQYQQSHVYCPSSFARSCKLLSFQKASTRQRHALNTCTTLYSLRAIFPHTFTKRMNSTNSRTTNTDEATNTSTNRGNKATPSVTATFTHFNNKMKALILPDPHRRPTKIELTWKVIGIAVSGGPDSIALCLMAAEWAKQNNVEVIALTVNHGLRQESKDEAVQVHQWMKQLGIRHNVLSIKWPKEGLPAVGKLQEACRTHRYELLEQKCLQENVTHLLLGQHLDDQLETFFIRLSRKSGIDGLACMEGSSLSTSKLQIVRPLLELTKEQLVSVCVANDQTFFTDPSNSSNLFFRNRIRKALEQIYPPSSSSATTPAAGGPHITKEQLLCLINDMRKVREEATTKINDWIHANVYVHYHHGFAVVPARKYQEEIANQNRFLAGRLWLPLIRSIGGVFYAKQSQVFKAVVDRLPHHPGVTIGRVQIDKLKGYYVVTPQLAEFSDLTPIRLDEPLHWTGRFIVTVKSQGTKAAAAMATSSSDSSSSNSKQKLFVRSLLESDFESKLAGLDRRLPKPYRRGIPVIVNESGELVAVPHYNWSRFGFQATAAYHPKFPLPATPLPPIVAQRFGKPYKYRPPSPSPPLEAAAANAFTAAAAAAASASISSSSTTPSTWTAQSRQQQVSSMSQRSSAVESTSGSDRSRSKTKSALDDYNW